MPLTTLEKAGNKITRKIDAEYERANISQKMSRILRHELLILLVTGICRDNLQDFASQVFGIKNTIQGIENSLGKNNKLPQALYASYSKGLPNIQIFRDWKIKERDWDYVHGIARHDELSHNEDLRILVAITETPDYQLPWISEIELNYEDLEVIIDSNALEDMLLSVLETYRVPKGKGAKYTEAYGLCLGMIRLTQSRVHKTGGKDHLHVHVVRVPAQIRAKLSPTSCTPNPESWSELIGASNALFPHYEVVGDFHSHPFPSLNDLLKRKGWEPSPDDRESMPGDVKYMQARNHRIRVSLIVAIAEGHESSSLGQYRNLKNVLRFCIRGCHVFIAAYRVLSDGRLESERIQLKCPAIMGFK
jgi:hypothetical protein